MADPLQVSQPTPDDAAGVGGQVESVLDPVLVSYVTAPGDNEAEEILWGILLDKADPVILGILRHRSKVCSYGAARFFQDIAGIHTKVQIGLIGAMRRLRYDENPKPVESLRGYVAKSTYNAFHDYIRENHREWNSLKNSLKRLLKLAPFETWKVRRRTLCGTRALREKPVTSVARDRLEGVLNSPTGFVSDALAARDPERLKALLLRLFEWIDAPIELNRLVSAIAGLTGIAAVEVAQPAPDGDPQAEPPDTSKNPENYHGDREALIVVWGGICAMPLAQRKAFLLGFSEIHGLPMTGIASTRQIADVLNMPVESLTAIWDDLPLPDAAIASDLVMAPARVRIIRMRALDTLARRLGGPRVRRMRRMGARHES